MAESEKNKVSRPQKGRWWKILLWSVLGLWAVLLLGIQVALNSKVLKRIATSLANEYVEGDVDFSSIKASVFKSFPNLNVSIDGFVLTYPHERFAAFDSLIPSGDSLHRSGWHLPTSDTLASFSRLSASVNYMEALKKKIRIPHVVLEHPRLFLHRYDSLTGNWNVLRLPSSDPEDTTSFKLPPISIGRVSLEKDPFTVYTSIPDGLEGAVSLDHLSVKNHREQHYDVDLDTRFRLKTAATGVLDLPVKLAARFYPDFEKRVYSVKGLKASVAMIEMIADGLVDMSGENIFVKADASIDNQPVREVTGYFGNNFPILKKLKTDARISLDAHCDGYYVAQTKELPKMSVHLSIPDSKVGWEGIDEEGRMDLDATAFVSDGKLVTDIEDLCFHIGGADIQLKGSANDLLAGDPLMNIDSKLHLKLDSLVRFLPEDLGITASGNLDGNLKGGFKLSQLDIYNFGESGLSGRLVSDGIRIRDPKDSINAFLGRTSIELGPFSRHDDEGGNHDHVGISASVDSLFAEYGKTTFFRGRGIRLSAHNTEETIKGTHGRHPIHGHLDIASIGMMDVDSCFVGVRGSGNTIKLSLIPEGKVNIPYLSVSSNNNSVFIRESVNRYSFSGASLNLSAHPNSVEAKEKMDTLPGRLLPRLRDGKVPDFLSEKDFEKKDIVLKLGDGVAKYFNEWTFSGGIRIKDGKVITPYYPLENSLSEVSGKFTNNRIDLSSLAVKSGSSDVSASGSLTGIKRAITSGRGRLNLDMRVNSHRIDLNEILFALNAGKQFIPPGEKTALSGVDDGTYLNTVREEAVVDTSSTSSLIVIPANLNAKVSVQAETVKYSDLETSFVSTDLEMKERCLQVTNTLAMTNMGEVFLEGFYSTRTKNDLKAGFDLMLSNITAEKVIQLFPAVDSIMPMLKAFKGLLDCEIATTTAIDTSMNIVLPSLSGMIKIDGKDLSLSESEGLDKLRKTLMFKDKDSSYINSMSARGIIKENQLEVFPFILKVDRYTVALNGIQGFDQNFKYHVSAIKSPIPFKFGVNMGGNFDAWKWKLGKAKFKSTKIPLFDNEIDDVRLNLVNSIHNIFNRGVEQAMIQHEKAQEAVEEKKTEIAYSAEETEELSTIEQKALEALGEAVGEE